MRTDKLIQYSLFNNSYKVNSSRLSAFIQDVNTILGIRNHKLYYIAYREYKKFPWVYDMVGGDIILATKIFFRGLKYSPLEMDNLLFYHLIRGLCFNNWANENLDIWVKIKWVCYPKPIEDAYVKAYSKIDDMGYLKKDSIFSGHDAPRLESLLRDFIRFFYFATWEVIHQNEQTIGWWTYNIHQIILQDVPTDYYNQAKNIVNRYLMEIAQTDEYKSSDIHYY